MDRFTAAQSAVIQQLAHASWQNWHWLKLFLFISKGAIDGPFSRYAAVEGHLNPDKARQDDFGKKLYAVSEEFLRESKLWGKRAFELMQKVRALGIPDEIIEKLHLRAGKSKHHFPSMEKLLLYFPKTKPVSHGVKKLREEIQNSDSGVSQREINILAKYAEALQRKPRTPYQPSKRVKDYAKLKRHWGRMYKY